MNTTYLLLGSNMGNPPEKLAEARKGIAKRIGKIKRESGIYLTAAWGKTDQPDFLNQVIVVETDLKAPDTMQGLLDIEKKMGNSLFIPAAFYSILRGIWKKYHCRFNG